MQIVIEISEGLKDTFENSNVTALDVAHMKKALENGTVFPEGKWVENYDKDREWGKLRFYCSNCGRWQTYGKSKYCPNCGAKMEREDKE